METEIVFCERCGVSIPEADVARARQASGGRDLCAHCAGPSRDADGDLKLYFCENCRVSIAVSDVLTALAKPEGAGYLCPRCTRATPAERVARRTAVEREMAAPLEAATRAAPSDPLYFCDVCNASVPAVQVATGRALVQSGRTICERCRPRAEAARPHAVPGPGAVPVVAAALLAAAAAAAGVAGWQSWQDRAEALAEDPAATAVAELQREVRRLRETAASARSEAEDRLDRAVHGLERRVESVAAEVRDVRGAAAKPAIPEEMAGRLDRVEDRCELLSDEVAALRAELAAARRRPAPSPMPPEEPGEAPAEAAAPAPAMPSEPSAAVRECVAKLKDKDAGIRFSAAIELGKIAGRKAPSAEEAGAPADQSAVDFGFAWPALAESLRKDDDAFVRRACARSLGEIKAWDTFPVLCDALLDDEEYVALQASRVLKELAGQDFGFKQSQAKGDRKKVADRAKKWWAENQTNVAR